MATATKERKTIRQPKAKKANPAPVIIDPAPTREDEPQQEMAGTVIAPNDEVMDDTDEGQETQQDDEGTPTKQEAETKEVLVNPFKKGDTVSIPAGTTYTTSNPTLKGRQKTGRAQTVTVLDTFPSYLNRTKSGRVLVRPFRIRTTGSGGYWKDLNITEKIVKMNGMTPEYESMKVDV